jgi:hypothetical protein
MCFFILEKLLSGFSNWSERCDIKRGLEFKKEIKSRDSFNELNKKKFLGNLKYFV